MIQVALCQLNSTVGDISGNASRMLSWYHEAVEMGADLVVFPELALTGYPPRDLLGLDDFIPAVEEAISNLASGTGDAGMIFGTPLPNPNPSGKPLFNAAVLCAEGMVAHKIGKKLLPVYDVFDEARHFEPDPEIARPIEFRGIKLGLHICEDAWNEAGFWPRRLYGRDPVEELVSAGSRILVNISASPFHAEKIPLRRSLFQSHCQSHGIPLLHTNAVGGNDELVFDGTAYVFDAQGETVVTGMGFEEEMLMVSVSDGSPPSVQSDVSWSPGDPQNTQKSAVRPELKKLESVRRALVLGLRDYATKCGFSRAVLGLSGGIDSALTAVLAAEALGPENVWGVSLPGRYSSAGSLTDAKQLAENLGLRYDVLSIESTFTAVQETLDPLFENTSPGAAEENLQARARGMILMALSNKFGHLLLSTGNKSELAVGYCTLYGDMAGGLSVISDVPKTMVYDLARHLNARGEIIPDGTMTKAPSAELRPDQTDQDTLPPYELLDQILHGYIENNLGVSELVQSGLPEDAVTQVITMVTSAEYKRRQAAPGIRISPKAFGPGRRMPIATRWPPKK